MKVIQTGIVWSCIVLVTILGSFAQEEEKEGTCLADGTCQEPQTCEDLHDSCEAWSDAGECDTNPGYMVRNCAVSCGVCDPDDFNYEVGEIHLGVPQAMEWNRLSTTEIASEVAKTWEYMKTVKIRKSIREICKNKNKMCTIWSLEGECEQNPNYMKRNCAPACQSCDYLSTETRCPIDPNAPKAWDEGDLDRMFEKLTQEPYLSAHSVEILSSPATNGPWVITMENFVSPAEAERLIELGSELGYERSKGMARIRPDGTPEHVVSEARTSSHTWCRYGCDEDSISRGVIGRLSNVTGIDEMNSEYLQLLQYEPGQYYTSHHDYLKNELQRQQGNRILTVYLYLNDVEEGGGTNFDKLNITVMPKRGRALLWPSVQNDAPRLKDTRTTHQALPVEEGFKYGANAWFHIHDFKTPHANGCTE